MPPPRPRAVTLSEPAIAALVAERARFHRFLARQIGSEHEADDLLQASLLRALQRGDSLRHHERVVAWFYRILRRAVADHFRGKQTARQRLEQLEHETKIRHDTDLSSLPEWETAVCRCIAGVLDGLPRRSVELLRRIDLNGELRPLVAHELALTPATFDVALHRARRALRRRLEIFCGACSRESCLKCACPPRRSTT